MDRRKTIFQPVLSSGSKKLKDIGLDDGNSRVYSIGNNENTIHKEADSLLNDEAKPDFRSNYYYKEFDAEKPQLPSLSKEWIRIEIIEESEKDNELYNNSDWK